MTATPEGSERAAAADSDYSTSAVGLLGRHRKYKCMDTILPHDTAESPFHRDPVVVVRARAIAR